MSSKKIKSPLFIIVIVAILLGVFLVANPQQALAVQADSRAAFAQSLSTGTLTPTVQPTATQTLLPSLTSTNVSPTQTRSSTLQAVTPVVTENPNQIFACSDAWGASNSQIRSASPWISSTFAKSDDLKTKVKYEYLAARLLRYGLTTAPDCPNNGMTADGSASQCGVDSAYAKVVEWQNLFNDSIIQASATYRIPPVVLKGIFAQESQFWPGYYKNTWEAGLGHFTDNGADTALGWNYRLFFNTCSSVFNPSACQQSYFQFAQGEQAMLRGKLFGEIDATCSTCNGGISIEKANQSVAVFSQSLYAHCAQTGQIIRNSTNAAPAKSTSYDDLWRITLADYNAGAGCITNAIKRTKSSGLALTWTNVSQKLDNNCQGAIKYVNAIESFGSSLESPLPTSAPSATPTQAGSASPTPTATPSNQATQAPTVTPTSGN